MSLQQHSVMNLSSALRSLRCKASPPIRNKHTPIVKNKTVPICKNCVHFIGYKMKDPYDIYDDRQKAQCRLFGELDIIAGEMEYYMYASTCRANEKLCGVKGKYYEPFVLSETKPK